MRAALRRCARCSFPPAPPAPRCLLVSEDLDELFALSDRLIVLRDGRIAGDLRRSYRPDAVGAAMGGADAA